MKAVVLVGGEGTRLRPITETLPKPLVPLVDRPSLDHVLDHLAGHGVHEVVLSSSYLEETFHAFIQARRGDPSITWITETEPLGTGGAIVNALEAFDTDDALLRAQRRHPHRPGPHRDACEAPRSGRGGDDRAHARRGRSAVRPRADGRRRAGARVPREAVGAHAGLHQRGHLRPRPRRARGLDPRRERVDRARDLPGAHRRRTAARRVPVRGVLDGSRDAAGVPAGAVRPARRPGGRPPLRTRRRSSTPAAASTRARP